MNKDDALKLALEALEVAQANLRPHGDNCFLHDDGEYNRCFCGKDSLVSYLQDAGEKLDTAIKQARSTPVQPVQEPVWIQPDHLQKAQKAPFLCRVEPHKRDDFVPLYTTPPAQLAVPDALNPRDENPAYAAGWNDCRQAMLEILKARGNT